MSIICAVLFSDRDKKQIKKSFPNFFFQSLLLPQPAIGSGFKMYIDTLHEYFGIFH